MSKKTSSLDFDTETRFTGVVKWFNNRAGFGFVTVCLSPNEDFVGKDVFVHHTSLQVTNEQYKYLVQGEYVDFNLKHSESNDHPYQADNITGVANGKLMCETRWELRQSREGDNTNERSSSRRVRPRGSGPRDSMRRSSNTQKGQVSNNLSSSS